MPHAFTKRLPLLLILTSLLALDARAQVTAIRAGQLVDPAEGVAERDRVILVENGVITAVGPGLGIPAGATVIDLSDAVVLPGLVDAHTHVCLTLPTVGPDSPRPLYEELLFTGDHTCAVPRGAARQGAGPLWEGGRRPFVAGTERNASLCTPYC